MAAYQLPLNFATYLWPTLPPSCPKCLFHINRTHLTPRARPLVPPRPLPMPVPLLPVCDEPRPVPDTLLVPPATYPVPLMLPLPVPLPLPLVPLVPRIAVPACRCLSSSSSLRLASSRLLSSSAALLSAACAFKTISFSKSATSWLAPCQLGFKINRWLCSVCDSIRIQVFRSVEADVTVRETVWSIQHQQGQLELQIILTSIFPFATSRLDTTPSMTSLMLRTLSSSFRNEASRACSASYFDSTLRFDGTSDFELGFWLGLDTFEGLANRSSVSESERSNLPISGVDIFR